MLTLSRYGLVSSVVFAGTVLNAFRQRSNFYSAAVYLTKSNACIMILWNQAIFQTLLLAKLLQTIFFGSLRPLEVERLQERGWFAVTETLLALTIFRDEFDSSFIVLFVSLLFLKIFHWLATDRIELMEQSVDISRLFHVRMTALLALLWVADVMFLVFSIESILTEGPTVMIMFASEYMILVATIWSISMKYGINVVDLRAEEVWEEKSMFVFYVDLVTDFFKLVTYLVFFGLILTFYGLPINILRDVYVTFRSFILKCRDLRRYRQATNNMETLYPDATRDEMTNMVDKTCIICREDMEYRGILPPVVGDDGVETPAPAPPARSGPNDTPKRLPCGHVFHFHCLRSWLERQQSCPTCRRPVLGAETPVVPPAEANRAALAGADPPAVDPVWQARVNLARNLGREAFAVVFPNVDFPPEADRPEPLPPLDRPGATDAPVFASRTTPVIPTSATENPLANFSLGNMKLPPTGEAGLYSSPGGVANGYAGVAYGAYPASQGHAAQGAQMVGVGGPSGPGGIAGTGRGAGRTMNLEERLAVVRSRIPTPTTSTFAAAGPPPPPPPTTTTTPAPAAPTATVETDVEKEQEEVEEDEAAEGGESVPPTRDARAAAAERRALLSRPFFSSSSTLPPLPPNTVPLPNMIPLAPSPAKSSSTSTALPRLIPLFDPTNPRGSTLYPHLQARLPPSLPSLSQLPSTPPLFLPARQFPSIPLLSPPLSATSSNSEELKEMEKLSRELIFRQFRIALKFKKEMENLVIDLRKTLENEGLKIESEEKEEEEEEGEKEEEGGRKLEKGKSREVLMD